MSSTGRGYGSSGGAASGAGGRREGGRGGGRGNAGGRGNSSFVPSSGRGYYTNQSPLAQQQPPQYSSGGGGPYPYTYSNMYSQPTHQYSTGPLPPGYIPVYPHAQHPQASLHPSAPGAMQYFHPTAPGTSQIPSSSMNSGSEAGGGTLQSPLPRTGGASTVTPGASYHPSVGMSLPNVQGMMPSSPSMRAMTYASPMAMSSGMMASTPGRGSSLKPAIPPRERKILTVRDKDGNIVDLGDLASKKDASAEKTNVAEKVVSGSSVGAKEVVKSNAGGKAASSQPSTALYDAAVSFIQKKDEEAKQKQEQELREKEEAERLAREKEEAERLAREKEEAERLAKEKEEAERLAREKEEAERLAKEKEEAERLAKEKEEAERLAKEKEEAEKLAREKEEAERKKEADAKMKLEQEAKKAENESLQIKKAEQGKSAWTSRGRKFGGGGGGSLSELAAKIEEKDKLEKHLHKDHSERRNADYLGPDRRDKSSTFKESAGPHPSESHTKINTSSPVEKQSAPAATQSLRPGGNGDSDAFRPGGGFRPSGALGHVGGLRPGGGFRPDSVSTLPSNTQQKKGTRRVFTKEELLRFRDLDICCCRPNNLQDMTVTISYRGTRGGGSGGGAGGGRGGGQWPKESFQNQGNRRRQGEEDKWTRARTPPKGGRGRGGRGRGGRGGRGRGGYVDEFEGPPPKPLVKSENRWMPVKDTSVIAVTEKKVKSILNKMTKEKFEKLSEQMIEIPITSLEVLTMMIHHVYEKAIFEPSFGDIYAELCIRLSEKAKRNPFVKIIESDEEPPTENGEAQDGKGASSHNTVYRWSNDVSTDDSEVIGPFESVEDCLEAALDADNCPEPTKRYDEMALHAVRIYAGQFIKIMHPVDNPEEFYTVFFPVSKAKEIGQQISDEIFLSEIECRKNGLKNNSFKSILLNKCQDEFKKKDIYDEWRIEKKAYEEQKDSFSESERLEKEEDLEFRRMKIKKQMLGNIRFIGELFKIGMLKVKVMRDCIESLLRLSQQLNADGQFTGNLISLDDQDMDEEDHEAVCKLFTTIGSTIDQGKYRDIIDIYFSKISEFSNDKSLSARCRFLYKDLIDLRKNNWVARRKEEKAKTLDEIKKEFEREERIHEEQQNQQLQQQQRNQMYRGMKDNNRRGSVKTVDNRRGGGIGDGDYRHDNRDGRRAPFDSSSSRSRTPRDHYEPKPDSDGFTPVTTKSTGVRTTVTPRILSRDDSRSTGVHHVKDNRPQQQYQSRSGSSSYHPSQHQERHRQESKPSRPGTVSSEPPMSEDKLKQRAKSMKLEFMEEKNEEELLQSMDDLKSSPNAGTVICQTYVEDIIESKVEECEAIVTILSILYRNRKLSQDDISNPFAETIEFLDSYVMDSHFALDNISNLMAEFLHIGALDVNWLCENVKKLEETSPKLIPTAIASCLKSSMRRNHAQETKSHFDKASSALTKLLTDEGWNKIKRESGL